MDDRTPEQAVVSGAAIVTEVAVANLLKSESWQKRLEDARGRREKVLAERERMPAPQAPAPPAPAARVSRLERLPTLAPVSPVKRKPGQRPAAAFPVQVDLVTPVPAVPLAAETADDGPSVAGRRPQIGWLIGLAMGIVIGAAAATVLWVGFLR